jgi:hypothetical protein
MGLSSDVAFPCLNVSEHILKTIYCKYRSFSLSFWMNEGGPNMEEGKIWQGDSG